MEEIKNARIAKESGANKELQQIQLISGDENDRDYIL
jgi:hypothetical protein